MEFHIFRRSNYYRSREPEDDRNRVHKERPGIQRTRGRRGLFIRAKTIDVLKTRMS